MSMLEEIERQTTSDPLFQSVQICDDFGCHGHLEPLGTQGIVELPIQKLPEELLDSILAYVPTESLPSCTLVCRAWHIPASRPVMRTVSLNDDSGGFCNSKEVLLGFLAALETSARMSTLVRSLLLIDMSQVDFHILQEIMGLLVNLQRYLAIESYFIPLNTPVDPVPFPLKSLEEVIIICEVPQSSEAWEQHMQPLLAPLLWCTAIEDLTISLWGSYPFDPIPADSSQQSNLVPITHQLDVKDLRLGSKDGEDEFLSLCLPFLTCINTNTLRGLYLCAGDHNWNELLKNYGPNITTCYMTLVVGDIGKLDAAMVNGRSTARKLSFSPCTVLQELSLNLVWKMHSRTGNLGVIAQSWKLFMNDLRIPSLTDLRLVLFWEEEHQQHISQFQRLVDAIDWRLLNDCVDANPMLASVTIDLNLPAWLNKTMFVGTPVDWHENSSDFRVFPKDPITIIQSHVSLRTQRILHVECDDTQNSTSQPPK